MKLSLKPSESLLITSRPNIFYFSGVDIAGGVFLLITRNRKYIFSDARFIKEASRIARGSVPVAISKSAQGGRGTDLWWRKTLARHRIKTVYFEPHDATFAGLKRWRRLSKGIARLLPSPIDLRVLRSVKRKDELAAIKKAISVTETIMSEVVQHIRAVLESRGAKRLSEYECALFIRSRALLYGCEELSFDPIIAFGKNSGVPHHRVSRARFLKTGDIVLIDMGVKHRGYCADITRTFFTSPPGTRQTEIYNRVLASQTAAIARIKNGARASDVCDVAARELGDLASHFTHGLGHGVGVEIHEHPNLKPKSPDVLQSGQVITVEPGLYFNWGGVRIEDVVVVTDDGAKRLTTLKNDIEDAVLKNPVPYTSAKRSILSQKK